MDESRLSKIARFSLGLLPQGMVVPILYGGLRGRRWIVGSAIHRCWLGFYECEKQRLISRVVRAGGVFWDVGANVGFYSLLASRLVASGKVFAFEPVQRNLVYLRKHLALNRVTNVEVLELAVSDQNGTTLFETEETGCMGHISDDGPLTVTTATLDRLVDEDKVAPPDYVKMDIEGAEFSALWGARHIFQRVRPVLFLATHSKPMQEQCCQLLESWGYKCHSTQDELNPDLGDVFASYPGKQS